MRYENEGALHRGAWAGHRFEITSMERFRPLKPRQGRQRRGYGADDSDLEKRVW